MRLHRSVLASLLICVVLLTGCTSSWVSTALADLPVLVSMAESIIQLLGVVTNKTTAQEAYAIQHIGDVAKQGLTAIDNLYKSYKSNPDSGTLQKITSACDALQVNLQELLTAAQVKDPVLRGRGSAAVAIIVTTVGTFELLIPKAGMSHKQVRAAIAASSLPTPTQLKAAWLDQVGLAVK